VFRTVVLIALGQLSVMLASLLFVRVLALIIEGKLCITFFKGGPADPSQQEKEHPTASKIHATLDSCPL
jgi:hypothetical protein